MPTASKKPLYMAKTISQLNKMAESVPKVTNAKIFLKSAEKVFKTAEDCLVEGDEEKAYVMYMKFFNIISGIKKTAEYKKNEKFYKELIGTKNCIRAINQAEALSSSLKERYDEKEAEEVSHKLEVLNKEREEREERWRNEEKEKEKGEDAAEKTNGEPEKGTDTDKPPMNGEKEVEDTPASDSISVLQLYQLLLDKTSNILMIDIRSADQFEASHINHKSCINIPAQCIAPGCTVHQIEKQLPDSSEALWLQRGHVNQIILLDWHSSASQLQTGTTLRSLKDALYKWDSEVFIKKEPVVLEGGYNDWLTYYPTLTTNASVPRPPSYNTVTSSVSLDRITYDLEFLEPEPKPVNETKNKLGQGPYENTVPPRETRSLPNEVSRNSIPTVDRSRKPTTRTDVSSSAACTEMTAGTLNNTDLNKKQPSVNAHNLNFQINDITEERKSSPLPAKDTNLPKQNNVDTKTVTPTPNVDRSSKPRRSSEERISGTKSGPDTSVSAAEINALHSLTEKKQDELKHFQQENARLVAEHKARVARLESDQQQIEEIEARKKKELRETADLLRQKKKIQEELAKLEEERKKRDEEESARIAEVKRLQEEEAQKQKLKLEADRLREDRKKKKVPTATLR